MAKPASRLAAVLAVLNHSAKALAERWSVDLSHMANIRRGRATLGPETAARFRKDFGLSPDWLAAGRGPIFEPGRSPGDAVERAIVRHLDLGPPDTSAVPLFESVEDVRFERSLGDWHEYPLRGLMPIAAARREGFYLHVLEKGDADVLGCVVGSHALFVPAQRFVRKTRVAVGDVLPCIVEAKVSRRLCRFTVADIVAKKLKPAAARSRRPHDTKVIGSDKTTFFLKQLAPSGAFRGGEVKAIAVRSESDLLGQSGDA